MTDEHNVRPHRWAPEWIAVLTLAVAIVALGGGLFTTLNAIETRIREDMGAMETRIREDVRELRRDVDTLQESTARIDERVSSLNGRVSRLETRFDEEFPLRATDLRSSAPEVPAGPPAAARRPFETDG